MARLATPDGLGGWDWGGLGFDDVIVVLSEGRPTVVEAGSGSVAARLSTAVAGGAMLLIDNDGSINRKSARAVHPSFRQRSPRSRSNWEV